MTLVFSASMGVSLYSPTMLLTPPATWLGFGFGFGLGLGLG